DPRGARRRHGHRARARRGLGSAGRRAGSPLPALLSRGERDAERRRARPRDRSGDRASARGKRQRAQPRGWRRRVRGAAADRQQRWVRTLTVKDRKEWAAWLRSHHRTAKEIWLVYHRRASGKPRIAYNDAARNRPAEFRKRLRYFITMTARGNTFGYVKEFAGRGRSVHGAGRNDPR